MHRASDITESMRQYYAQRAQYYERVYFKPERQHDLRRMEAALADTLAGHHVLEIACGTGWWTPHGARRAASWLATDINPETLALASAKELPATVRFATVDAYTLQGLPAPCGSGGSAGSAYTAAFAGCWWSHVPLQRLPSWLDLLHLQLAPGARVVFLDNSFVQTSSTPLTRRDEYGNTYQNRVLDDGSVHEVVKNFPQPEQAMAVLGNQARDPQWLEYEHYWVLTYRLR